MSNSKFAYFSSQKILKFLFVFFSLCQSLNRFSVCECDLCVCVRNQVFFFSVLLVCYVPHDNITDEILIAFDVMIGKFRFT